MSLADILKAIGSFAPSGPGAPASPYRAELLREQVATTPILGRVLRRVFIGI